MGPALYTRRRWVVPGRRLTSTTELLKQCNYLSVQQMVHYHSVALVHKVLVHQAPVHLYHIVSRALASGVRHLYLSLFSLRQGVSYSDHLSLTGILL